MKKCPYCAEQIQDEAIICRFCNRDLKESPVIQESKVESRKNIPAQQTNNNPPKKTTLAGWIFIIVLGALLLFSIFGNIGGGDNGKKDHSTMASVLCRSFVRDRLKSPSTAKFPTTSAQDLGSNIFLVNSYVDAENSFGATLRNKYYCKVQYISGDEGDSNNWKVIQLEISE